MNGPLLFIIALKSDEHPAMPTFCRHAGEAAKRHSGCETILLSNYDVPGWDDARPFMHRVNRALRAISRNNNKAIPRQIWFISRWFVIHEFITHYGYHRPVISIDWDALIFQELWPHFVSCGITDCDYAASYDRNRSRSFTAPIVINNLKVLDMFVRVMTGVFHLWPPALLNPEGAFAGAGDMLWWNKVAVLCGYKIGTVSNEVNSRMFDPNIILDEDLYEHDGCQGKRIVTQDGQPHFVRKDGTLVKAVAIHCFMSWKNRTGELISSE
jgi:hypothetical protein